MVVLQDCGFRTFSGYLPNSSSSELIEDTDGSKTKAAMDHVLVKIDRTKDLIRSEQTARDGMIFMLLDLMLANLRIKNTCNFFKTEIFL